jgi:hypothetical protein
MAKGGRFNDNFTDFSCFNPFLVVVVVADADTAVGFMLILIIFTYIAFGFFCTISSMTLNFQNMFQVIW